jgi:hypothetical protein
MFLIGITSSVTKTSKKLPRSKPTMKNGLVEKIESRRGEVIPFRQAQNG